MTEVTLYARMRPHDPKGGQPHKKMVLAPLNMTFHAGKFIPLQPKIAARLRQYLERQYPEDDTSRPCLYQVVSKKQMDAILAREAADVALKKRAEMLGINPDELRRMERQSRQTLEMPSNEFDQDRADRLRYRQPTELEIIAAQATEASHAKELQELQAKKIEDERVAAKARAFAASKEAASKTVIEGFDDEEYETSGTEEGEGEESELWGSMKEELEPDPKTNEQPGKTEYSPSEIDDLLGGK